MSGKLSLQPYTSSYLCPVETHGILFFSMSHSPTRKLWRISEIWKDLGSEKCFIGNKTLCYLIGRISLLWHVCPGSSRHLTMLALAWVNIFSLTHIYVHSVWILSFGQPWTPSVLWENRSGDFSNSLRAKTGTNRSEIIKKFRIKHKFD